MSGQYPPKCGECRHLVDVTIHHFGGRLRLPPKCGRSGGGGSLGFPCEIERLYENAGCGPSGKHFEPWTQQELETKRLAERRSTIIVVLSALIPVLAVVAFIVYVISKVPS